MIINFDLESQQMSLEVSGRVTNWPKTQKKKYGLNLVRLYW